MTTTATAPLAPSADTFNALRQKLESQPYECRRRRETGANLPT